MSDASPPLARPGPILPNAVALASEEATRRLGESLAPRLGAGDWVSLTGPLGAGKSTLARAVIRARLGHGIGGAAVEVPSPTYTLVNVFDGDPEIWHADLYRMTDPAESEELGLLDDLAGRIVLAEWAERLGGEVPARRLEIALDFCAGSGGGAGRTASLNPVGDWNLEGIA